MIALINPFTASIKDIMDNVFDMYIEIMILAIPMVSFLLFMSSRLRRDKLASDIICHVLFVFSLISIVTFSYAFLYNIIVPLIALSPLLFYAFILPYEYKNEQMVKGLKAIVVLMLSFILTQLVRSGGSMDYEIWKWFLWCTFRVGCVYIAAKLVAVFVAPEKLGKYEKLIRRIAYGLCFLLVLYGITICAMKGIA